MYNLSFSDVKKLLNTYTDFTVSDEMVIESIKLVQGVENSFPVSKVIFFDHKDGRYVAKNGKEIEIDFILNHEYVIQWNGGYIVLEK